MRSHSYPLDPTLGPVIDVIVRASERATKAKLLISTATKRSYLSPNIADRIGLVTTSGIYVTDLYFADFDVTMRCRLLVYEGVHPRTQMELDQRIEGVLGRDCLKHAQLKISGVQRLLTLSM